MLYSFKNRILLPQFQKKKTKKKQYKIIGLKIKIFIIHNELMNLYSSIFLINPLLPQDFRFNL